MILIVEVFTVNFLNLLATNDVISLCSRWTFLSWSIFFSGFLFSASGSFRFFKIDLIGFAGSGSLGGEIGGISLTSSDPRLNGGT